jgi:hypothetical protein
MINSDALLTMREWIIKISDLILRGCEQYLSCPGRGAALFALLRRAGTQALDVANDGPRISSAPHSVSKTRVNALMALCSIRGTHPSS